MLRSVDGWEGEHFSFDAGSTAAPAVPTASTTGPTQIAIDNGADGPSATIPDSHLLFTAQFSRAGADLVLTGEDGKAFVVHDYFANDVHARLLSAEGAALSPDVVAALAGPLAPGQYAQAGTAQPAVKAVGRVVQADGDATIVRNGVAMAAHAGDAVLKGDVLQTVTGTFGVTFNDGSTLNLTANSRLVVNEFVYDPNGAANSQLLDLVQGSLTFISGEVAHNGNMKIGTPVATMAIRGTVGGVTTANDGTVHFYVSQSATGAVILDGRGTVIANVVQDGPLIVVRPVGPLQVLAEEVQKTPAQLATELAALQQIVSIQSVGQQILQQFFQQDPNANPNPQSTDRPHTQFQIDLHTNGPNGTNDTPGLNDGNPPPTSATVTSPPTDENDPATPVDVTITANLPPLTFAPLQQAATEDTALVFSSAHGNAISVFDADTALLTVTVVVAHGVVTLSGVAGLTFTSGDGSGDVTMTFSGTQDAINAALDGMSFTPDAEYNGAASVSVTTSDGHSTSATDTVEITVAAVNDAPIIAQAESPTLAYTENQAATAIDTALTLSDVDSATLSGATVTISGHFHSGEDVLSFVDQNGITGHYDSETGVLTLSGTASVADYQAALQSVAYANSSDHPSADTRTISYQVDDGSADNHLSNVATASVTVASVNDVPVLDYFNLTIAEGGTTVLSTSDFHITDPDSCSFFFSVADVTGGQFEVLTGESWVAAPTGGFTADDIAAGHVRFVHDGGETAPAFTVWASDNTEQGAGAPISPSVDFTNVNDAPVADAQDGSLAYIENQAATAIDAALTLSDIDSANLTGATVSIGDGFHSSEDVLTFVDQNGITGHYDSEIGVLTLSGTASVADYQVALQSVAYANTSDNPSADTRTIRYQVDDGEGENHEGNVVTASVTVTPVNDAPVIAQSHCSTTMAYTENQAATAIDTALTLSDVDSATLSGATVSIGDGFHSGEDVLSFVDQNGITGSYDSESGVLTLSGTASVADYQAALQSVAYANTSDSPSADTRTISFQVDDGACENHASNVVTANVTVTPVNDAPVITFAGGGGGPDQIQHDTSTGLALDSTYAVRGLATDGQFLYVDDGGIEIDVYTLAGSFVDSHAVDNLAGGSNQMTFADGHLYARNGNTIYLISTEDWSSTAVSVPEGVHGLLIANQWMAGDLLSLPDGRVGVMGDNSGGTTTLRLYTVGEGGTSFTWSEDIILQTAGQPGDNHGSASDGTYVYIADYSINGYRSYSLATGELVYTSGDITDSGTGADLDNPTFLTHDHVNGEYILGSYYTPAVLLSAGHSNEIAVAENTTAVTTIVGSDVDAGTILTYSIAGGADAALFAINASTGVLTFNAAPDYEAPADQGADNIYDVTVRVSDGELTATRDVAIHVTDVDDAPPAPVPQPGFATVSEEGLPRGIADATGDTDTTNSATASGTIAVTGDANALTFTLGQPETDLTYNGEQISWDGVGTNSLTGNVGETPVLTVTIDADGHYEVTLNQPVDHPDGSAEDVISFDVPVTVSNGQQSASTTITVGIEDDSPNAVAYSAAVKAGPPTVNIVIILDISGSMDTLVSENQTRLDLAKAAIQHLLETTAVTINQVMAVSFGTNAIVNNDSPDHSGVWTSAADADSFIQGLTTNGNTYYDRAITAVDAAWTVNPTEADRTLVYFITDGVPTSGHGADTTTWETLVSSHGVDASYAVGIGASTTTALDPIAWTPADANAAPVILDDPAGLDATLQATIPEVPTHSIFADTTVGFGADGGHIASVSVDGVIYSFDGDNTIHASDDSGDRSGISIDVPTALGGTFTFYFAATEGHAAGDWTYAPPDQLTAPAQEVFHYVLTDNDGDTSGADLTVSVTADSYVPAVDLDSMRPGAGFENTAATDDNWYAVFSDNVTVSDFDSTALQSATVRLDYLGGEPGNYAEYTTWSERFTIDVSALSDVSYNSETDDYTVNGFSGLRWEVTSGGSGLYLNITGAADAATYAELLNAVRFSSHSGNFTDREIQVTVSDGANDSAVATTVLHLNADSRAAGELVANGGFEAITATYNEINFNYNHWVFGGENVSTDASATDDRAHSGSHDAAFAGVSGDVTLSQDIPTVDGEHYTLSFWVANGDTSGNEADHFSVSWNGTVLSDNFAGVTDTYQHYVFDVIGGEGQTELQFAAVNPPNYWLLDDVSVRAGAPDDEQEIASGTVSYVGGAGPRAAEAVADSEAYAGNFTVEYTPTDPTESAPGLVAWHFALSNTELDSLAPHSVAIQSYDITVEDNQSVPIATLMVSVSIGGADGDTFIFDAGQGAHLGADTIVNFNTTLDVIELDNYFSNESSLLASIGSTGSDSTHGNAIIDLGTVDPATGQHDTITIANVTQDYLQQHLEIIHLNSSIA